MKSHKLWIFLGAVIVFAAASLPVNDIFYFAGVPGNILMWLTSALVMLFFEQFFAYQISGHVVLVLAVLPIVILYLLACLFIKPPYKIRLPVTIFSALFIGLSTIYYLYAYVSSARSYTDLYLFNFGMIAGMLFVFIYNRRRPSFCNALLFTVLFFAWLGYVSFPWIGPGEVCC